MGASDRGIKVLGRVGGAQPLAPNFLSALNVRFGFKRVKPERVR